MKHNGEIYVPKMEVNQRGVYEEELEKIKKGDNYKGHNEICIEEEVERYNLCNSVYNSLGLEKEVFQYKLWKEAYGDNNINGFRLPISVKNNDEYRKILEKKLLEYVKYLNRPAFVYDRKLLGFIKEECKLILKSLDHLINNDEQIADKMIEDILSIFKEDTFLVSDLDKSYSFRGTAPFVDLRSGGYDDAYTEMMNKELTFYRVRTKKKDDKEKISDIEHMLHLPYN